MASVFFVLIGTKQNLTTDNTDITDLHGSKKVQWDILSF